LIKKINNLVSKCTKNGNKQKSIWSISNI
jgi:hypothetical protein